MKILYSFSRPDDKPKSQNYYDLCRYPYVNTSIINPRNETSTMWQKCLSLNEEISYDVLKHRELEGSFSVQIKNFVVF